ncbi:putative adenylate cyclase [Operophtera brumata]|uniref:Putative adenylate cyclase n=1 Tax=Operophtera brumata TaxID=104452 RepID=A0A0L7L4E3_OPEBR|nr:putative adenylate cyclase [Operophtera brumata]
MVPAEEQMLKKKNEENDIQKKTFRDKIEYIKDNITVEPILICYTVSKVLGTLATQNLNLDKACRVNKNYGDIVCDALIARQGSIYLKEELAVQELIAAMEIWKEVLLTAIPSILILFLGAWSDRTGKRKLCILLPIFGNLLTCLSNMLCYLFELRLEITMFFEAFFPAITGSWITIFMGAFAYISNTSSMESRTFRVGIGCLCLTVGGPIGSVLSGVLLKHIGYYGVFSLSSLLYIISIVYGYYYIEEPKRPEKSEKVPSNVRVFLKSFFDVQHVKDTLTVSFKKGPNHRRAKSILVLASIAFLYSVHHGEATVRYLFTRYRFNWDALKYSFYSTFFICIHSLGALISISLFSHRLKWDDSVLGLISTISKVIGALATGFARNSMEMYIGKMTSFFNLIEVLAAMLSGPLYSWIYMLTVKFNAGIIYYVSTVLTIPTIFIFGWFYMLQKKSTTLKKYETSDKEEKAELNEMEHRKHDVLLNSIELKNEK